jgi:nucleoside-diphosphate-sugar epimerase
VKTALVTGSAGFAGRHYVRALKEDGWSVIGIDLNGEGGERGDARDFFRTAAEWSFDLVIHCAAVVGGRQVIDGAPLALASNLELDAGLFQWALRTRPGRIVYVSSSAAYPVSLQKLGDEIRLRESYIDPSFTQPGGAGFPDQLYGWTKLTGENLAHRARQEGLNVTVIRPFSGYGEDQDLSYPFRAFAERARIRADPFRVWGNPRQCRDFIHVDDIVAATLLMVREGIDGPVNLGTGNPTALGDLALAFTEHAGYEAAIETVPDAPMGVEYRVADPAYLYSFYAPKISLDEGIRRALA